MKAWYFDNLPGDQRLKHREGSEELSLSVLSDLGIIAKVGQTQEDVDAIATERHYKNRDQITVSKAGLGDTYEKTIQNFFQEHFHVDEEIRWILDGYGLFDVRDKTDTKWIRVFVEKGDLVLLPPGIYHRFTLDETNYIKAVRLFKDEPKWKAYYRSAITEKNPARRNYVYKYLSA